MRSDHESGVVLEMLAHKSRPVPMRRAAKDTTTFSVELFPSEERSIARSSDKSMADHANMSVMGLAAVIAINPKAD